MKRVKLTQPDVCATCHQPMVKEQEAYIMEDMTMRHLNCVVPCDQFVLRGLLPPIGGTTLYPTPKTAKAIIDLFKRPEQTGLKVMISAPTPCAACTKNIYPGSYALIEPTPDGIRVVHTSCPK